MTYPACSLTAKSVQVTVFYLNPFPETYSAVYITAEFVPEVSRLVSLSLAAHG